MYIGLSIQVDITIISVFQLWLAASVISSLFGYQTLLLCIWPPRVPLPGRLTKQEPVI